MAAAKAEAAKAHAAAEEAEEAAKAQAAKAQAAAAAAGPQLDAKEWPSIGVGGGTDPAQRTP